MNINAKGRDDRASSRLTYGLEWGYVATVHSAYHYYFFAPEGYRLDYRGKSFTYLSNADMYIHFGYDFNPHWNLSMYIGYEGIADIHKAIPVSLRMTRFFAPMQSGDRLFSFIDAGSGICIKKPVQEIFTGKLGGGYRMALGGSYSLDFLITARFIYTHPAIIYDKHPIAFDRINRNNAYITAVSLGMALNF